MSLAVWLGEDKKCSAAVVGLDLPVRVIYGTAVFIKSVFYRRFVSPMYCKLHRLH